jgi:hypothetical protein
VCSSDLEVHIPSLLASFKHVLFYQHITLFYVLPLELYV